MFHLRHEKKPISHFYLSLTKFSYGMGAVLVAFALILSTGILPVNASPAPAPSQQGTLFCDFGSYQGSVVKVEDQESPWTFTVTGNGYISVVGIKAATECAILFTSDGSSTCYRVEGIGTKSVTVWDRDDAPPECRDISHLEILVVDPTPSPTATEVPPTETPDPTPTATDVPPTETPESTPTATDDPATETPDSTPTATDIPPTGTPVPTLPPPSVDPETQLIPVTGFESPISAADIMANQAFLTRISSYTGIFFFGLGLVSHGAALWRERKEDQ